MIVIYIRKDLGIRVLLVHSVSEQFSLIVVTYTIKTHIYVQMHICITCTHCLMTKPDLVGHKECYRLSCGMFPTDADDSEAAEIGSAIDFAAALPISQPWMTN